MSSALPSPSSRPRGRETKPRRSSATSASRSLTQPQNADNLTIRSSGALFFMAKTSQLARRKKRERLVTKYAAKAAALKAAGEYDALQKLPRNASPVRLKNRCAISGRSRGYMRAFGLSRIQFRELAREGKIPGVKKASW